MELYEVNPECVKCGGSITGFKYTGDYVGYDGDIKEGFIIVTCSICGYEWQMETKYSKPERGREK